MVRILTTFWETRCTKEEKLVGDDFFPSLLKYGQGFNILEQLAESSSAVILKSIFEKFVLTELI